MTRRRVDAPGPVLLESTTRVRVRFQEVDSLRMVWHGHYITYLELARTAFGREFGLTYESILAAGYHAPIVHLDIDYVLAARYGDELDVCARLHREDGAKMRFTYDVKRGDECLARGSTLQVFTSEAGELVLVRPAFFQAFLDRWPHDTPTR